jgi:3-hydroxyisobutyrate dehydrogenase-like beta-hydroxyacid dehydrogenase
MADRLLDAGIPLAVWNRTTAKALQFAARGALTPSSIEATVSDADVVMSSLMDDASVEAQFGPRGPAFGALRAGAIHVSLTTISPECADRLQESHASRGAAFVSGPVVGRPDAAATGTLLQFLSGDASAMASVEPLCSTFADHRVRIAGSAGAANRQKLCTNFFVISIVEAMGEALAFAERCGASRDLLATAIERSFAAPAFQGYARRLRARDTSGEDGFSLRAGRKDLQLISDEASRCGCRLELADVITRKMQAASARGMDDCDWSVIAEISRTKECVR